MFRIWIYHGDGREKTSKNNIRNIDKLYRDHSVFAKSCPGQNVVITSYFTAVARHGLKIQRGWMVSKGYTLDEDVNVLPEPDTRWEQCLKGLIGLLILDEVHQIHNMDTQTFKTMLSMRGQFNLLMSATPSFTNIEDLKGMLSFLFNPANEKAWDKLSPPKDWNPFIHDMDPQYRKLMFTVHGLNK